MKTYILPRLQWTTSTVTGYRHDIGVGNGYEYDVHVASAGAVLVLSVTGGRHGSTRELGDIRLLRPGIGPCDGDYAQAHNCAMKWYHRDLSENLHLLDSNHATTNDIELEDHLMDMRPDMNPITLEQFRDMFQPGDKYYSINSGLVEVFTWRDGDNDENRLTVHSFYWSAHAAAVAGMAWRRTTP